MRKNVWILILFFCLSNFANAQKWQQFSDSIFVNFKANKIEEAYRYVKLADADLNQVKFKKDTIYAEYLYRKGITKNTIAQDGTPFIIEALSIWDKSTKKNYTKIMKIHYFIGSNYQEINNTDLAIKHYENCYEINKKYNLGINRNYEGSIFELAFLNNIKKNKKNTEKYASEYISLMKLNPQENFDYRLLYCYIYLDDYKGREALLMGFLDNYIQKKLNYPILLFKIYAELYFCYEDNNQTKEQIKYGELALDLFKKNNIEVAEIEQDLKSIFTGLIYTYSRIGDNINQVRFKNDYIHYFPEDNKGNYYRELLLLSQNQDFENFKIKFKEYEAILISSKNYNTLVNIYTISLTLFERNILFSKEDIENQIEIITTNVNLLDPESNIWFNGLKAEFYLITFNFSESLKISNQFLNIKNDQYKLIFYKMKTVSEVSLGNENAIKTAYQTLAIAEKTFGKNTPELLPFLSLVLTADAAGNDKNSTLIATQGLKLLYDNKLENTNVAVAFWSEFGKEAMKLGNYKSAIFYYEKSLKIQESEINISNNYNYYSILLSLSQAEVLNQNYEVSFSYLEKCKKFIEVNFPNNKMAYADFNYYLADYYFNSDDFQNAKKYYNISFDLYGLELSKMRKINYIICSLFIDNDTDAAIKSLESYQKDTKITANVSKIIYLLYYNKGEDVTSRNLLITQLKQLITENNQFFTYLSNEEKAIFQKKFIDQFEFLNAYLLSNDYDFLNDYLKLRFYSKSLLLYSSNLNSDTNTKLYSEYKENINLMNELKGSQEVEIQEVNLLKIRNTEIERILSTTNKNIVTPTLKELNKKLKSDEVYVEIIRINKQSKKGDKKAIDVVNVFTDSISYGAIIIKKNASPKFVLIDDTNQLENKFSKNFQNKIKSKQKDTESFHLLFEKIDKELQGINKIYLVTDGIYNSINIEAIFNPLNDKYLIDYLKIQQIQNVRTITDDKITFKVSSTSTASLFGNPDFDLKIKSDNDNLDLIEASRGLDSSVLEAIKGGVKISRLSGTEKEILILNSILKDGQCNVDLFSSNTATEDNLMKVQSPDILHIATHGYFLKNDDISKTKISLAELTNENYRNDSYLKSGLLFAGAQNTLNGVPIDGFNNGILSAEEAKSLDLSNTDLVVLSACDTGLGDNLVGEGVIGLQRAFIIAGAKSVIMSLWEVDDDSTQKLMTSFYTNWIKNKMSKEDALYQAKLEMKKLKPEPYYWAGFVLLE